VRWYYDARSSSGWLVSSPPLNLQDTGGLDGTNEERGAGGAVPGARHFRVTIAPSERYDQHRRCMLGVIGLKGMMGWGAPGRLPRG
jgi:hypothetical protein